MARLDDGHRIGSAVVGSERIGNALRALTTDLIAERRRVATLERENRELKAQVDALKRVSPERAGPAGSATRFRDAGRFRAWPRISYR